MQRRELLQAGLALPFLSLVGVLPTACSAQPSRPFNDSTVPGMARALAAQPFKPRANELPASLERIKYDEYRGIRYRPEEALWADADLPFQLQFFHRGFFFRDRVEIYTVVDGRTQPVVYRPQQFSFDNSPAPKQTDLGYAGFRLHAPINRDNYFDEVCAFLGATYFRAVAKDQLYGLSARGLALKTGDPGGEEFPVFRGFWIEQPEEGAESIVVHALMDSPSATGAFRFVITPGEETVFDVDLRLFPRVALEQAGIAPLTSMFQFDAGDDVGIDDYRPAVHDSGGLAMINQHGEQVWRPLRNPKTLQESTFADRNPRGFGLMQRKREFDDYADAEARYEKRPSLWVEPLDDWGEGRVHLFEIPTEDEFHDNIVAFWRPAAPLAAGREHRFRYRLHWCDRHEWLPQLASFSAIRIGDGPDGSRLVMLDLAGGRMAELESDAGVRAEVSASAGEVRNVTAHPNPGTGGWRIGFELHPGQAGTVELRALLRDGEGPLSETWLYRWTP